MLETSLKKNKVNLQDYNSKQDIESRMLMSDFSTLDVKVLEEILYSPLKISLKKLVRSIGIEESKIVESLDKFTKAGLLSLQDDAILVDKEMRKYFEFQIMRFSPDFKPDMEFLQGILRRIPIHLLPIWYSIPRTSNNMFESIVEKYLLTPQIYHRYLSELTFNNPVSSLIINDIFSSPDFKVNSSDLIAKYNLCRREFEEILLLFEFNFVATVCYEQADDHWVEFVIPFYEWHEYLRFVRTTEAPSIKGKVITSETSEFAFIEEMSDLLRKAKKAPVDASSPQAKKLQLIKLAEVKDGLLYPLEKADVWLDSTLENRALALYRHPHNHLLSRDVPEKYLREAEKSIKRVLHGEWVFFEDFLKGVLVPLSERSVISLKKEGKQWKYTLPIYSEEEQALIKATLYEWLYEVGVVRAGICEGKECFSLTPFGRFFFDD